MRTLGLLPLALLVAACSGRGGSDGASAADTPGGLVYREQCALCHGGDGSLGMNGAKDLGRSTLTRQEMIRIVTEGRAMMPPFGGVLRPDQIEAAVDHVLSLGPPA